MSDTVLSLTDRQHTPEKVLADLTRILRDEPESARDGIMVIMLDKGADGNAYNTRTLSSDLRYMEAVALCTYVAHAFTSVVQNP